MLYYVRLMAFAYRAIVYTAVTLLYTVRLEQACSVVLRVISRNYDYSLQLLQLGIINQRD